MQIKSAVLSEDLAALAEAPLPFHAFQNATVLITGATGLVGSLLTKTLLYCNQKLQLHLKVLALVRSPKKADQIFADLLPDSALSYIQGDLAADTISVPGPVDYIIHAAAVTASKQMVTDPVGTILTSIHGTEAMLRLAVEKQVKGMVYLSSMEVYGRPDTAHMVTEQDLGYVDLSAPRSCYPEGKRMCECLCTAYAAQFGLRVCSARLAQTFGAGILPSENRVFAQFARSALEGKDIVLHTLGQSEGNYVYTRDAVSGILTLLVKGRAGQAYNVANEESHITIRGMAEMVAHQLADGRIQVVVDLPKDANTYGYAPDVKMHLSSQKLRALGWAPQVGLLESYQRMIRWMQEQAPTEKQ